MRQLLCVALLLLCFAYGVIADGGQKVPGPGDSLWVTYVPYIARPWEHHHGDGWKPVRIAIGMATILEEIAACRYFRGVGEDSRFPGKYTHIDKAVCDYIGDLDRPHVLAYFREVVPEAVKLHADRLLVRPVEGKLKVPGNRVKFPRSACRYVQIGGYDEDYGIGDADVAIYVGVAASDKPSAYVCKTDDKGRPIAASIRLRAQDIISHDKRQIRLFAHLVAHGIGFDELLNNHLVLTSTGPGHHGIVTYDYSDVKMLKKVKEYFRCRGNLSSIKMEASMDGAPRLHFRHDIRGELMSPYHINPLGSNQMVYSALTLAVFESTGHFKAHFREAEEPTEWIRKQEEGVCGASEE